jgi:hypothetical protein
VVFEKRPLYGVQPQCPLFDLVANDTVWRRQLLLESYLVVSAPSGGFIVVGLAKDDANGVYYLPEQSLIGPTGEAENASRENFCGQWPTTSTGS